MNDYPSLKICGNPLGHGGFQDIYSLDGADIDIPNMDKVGMGGVPYFVVRITGCDVRYVFVTGEKIRTSDGLRENRLRMGISIPKHYRIRNGVSPYDVLMAVYETMKKENLSEIYGTSNLQYNERMCDESVFEALLQKYPLYWFESAFRPMTGSSAALLVTDKISEFMRDPHYLALQNYSEVIVAQGGAYPVRVPELQIPRVRQFSLYVNNKKDGRILSEKDGYVVIKCPNPAPLCYESYPNVTLSMADIVSKRVEDRNVRVDCENENIYYQFPDLKLRTVLWRVEVRGETNVKRINFTVQLTNGSSKNVDQKGEFNLTGQENLFSPKEILYNGIDDYYIANRYSNASMHCITVHMKKKPPMLPPGGVQHKDKGIEPHRNNDNKQKVVIVLPPKAFADNGKDHSGNIKLYPNGWGGEKDYHYKTVKFEPKWENADEDEVELWFSEIMLPPCSHPNNGKLYISVKTDKATYKGPGEMEDKNQYQRRNRPEIKSDAERYLDLCKVKWKSNSFCKRHNKQIIYSFMLLLVFALGIALGVNGERKWIESRHKENVDSLMAMGFYGQYCCLADDSVTFEEIDNLYATMNDLSAEVRSYLLDWEGIERRAEVYHKVVNLIQKVTKCDTAFTDTLKSALNPLKDPGTDDLPPNLEYCRYLYKKEKYDDNEDKLKQAQEKFIEKKDNGEINSFTDIESITEGLKPEQAATSPSGG